MGRKFDIPLFYRSSVISGVKNWRRSGDHRKQDLSPSVLDLGPVKFKIARHFGFCFGVENAIEIAYRAVQENPTKRVFLLSEMIHNPHVNNDLLARGVRFILAPDGKQLTPFEDLKPDDIVIVPAFGTTVELFEKLAALGIDARRYDATCPFVERVWKRSSQLGERGYTVIIHGKHAHEETRATFSHARLSAPSLVIRDIEEAKLLARYLRGEVPLSGFKNDFAGRYSPEFDAALHLQRIGVVNQTTMLAGETQSISALLREAMLARFGASEIDEHFADTRDTLCYATSENQDAIRGLIEAGGDLAIVVGGYNSSNTSHLVELLEQHVPTYYIKDADEILDARTIRHLELAKHEVVTSTDWLPPGKAPLEILITAGASCPDALVDQVLTRIACFFSCQDQIEQALQSCVSANPA
ncbi:MAG: 4-hydroxy-3-methylbut-2-enyl diphosphate reductase [Deltaproteobacteria bacterium]|nr:4-hydroxy-3-methylbut-2-enyl diphosphate reductase [Deltaproteobacteria bacterium]